MADPKLEVEERLEQLEIKLGRVELAVSTMATWLVQAQTGFNAQDSQGIERILRGESPQDREITHTTYVSEGGGLKP